MSFLDRFIDSSPALRCSKAEVIGRVKSKRFVKDAGFGDCPMVIGYEFQTASGVTVSGTHEGTESSFLEIEIGDFILIRYLEADSAKNAPRDALGIIQPVSTNSEPN